MNQIVLGGFKQDSCVPRWWMFLPSFLTRLRTAKGDTYRTHIEVSCADIVLSGKVTEVKFSFKWTESDGQKSASGTIEISDFTNDTTFGEEAVTAHAVIYSESSSPLP
eukprot:272929-Amphidinium_carterae.1